VLVDFHRAFWFREFLNEPVVALAFLKASQLGPEHSFFERVLPGFGGSASAWQRMKNRHGE